MYVNQDLKFAKKKIDELQKIVHRTTVFTLEKGHNESNSMQWQKYKSWLKNPKNNRVAQLGTIIKELGDSE